MNCTRCDYPLWNIKDRRCPECGQEFAPSKFTFVPRTVRFCCPHCEQHYFGTGLDGHLVPRAFDCVTCGHRIDMDEMVLTPAEGINEDQTRTGVNPWIDKRRKGFFGKWLATIGRGMVQPRTMIEQTPLTSSVTKSLWFAFITGLICTLINAGAFIALMVGLSLFMGPGGTGGAMFLSTAGIIIFALIAATVWLLVWLLLTHFILAISGPTAGGLRRTTQCMGYSSAPNILYAVPCISMYLAPIAVVWQVVSGAIMLARSQKVSGLRATIAMAAPPLLLAACVASLFMGWMMPAITTTMTMPPAAGGASTIQGIRAQSLCLTLHATSQANGAYPSHAVELLENGQASAGDFLLTTNPMDADNIPVGSTTLGNLEMLSPPKRTAAITAFVQAQPPNIIAHRLGNFVFTYHGLSAASSDRGLWVFIAQPPAPSPPPPPTPRTTPSPRPPPWMPQVQDSTSYFIGTVGGSTQTITPAAFPQALAEQNELRASFNLPPIPDPALVTHTMPALAPK